ncbi:MAG: aminotransferase class III-fold pyridoxal phosphate-dependent enzyme, partial [Balneolaceae bacterium]|nr:aminotransferase class III-fold pyridoxal phosphate-dependent enzyme [Balneolaceae bacterium]
ILCLAKAMAGGMPMGAFVSSSEIFEVFRHDPPLNHVTTFGGHPVSCAAAYATLSELLKEDFAGKAKQIESRVRKILQADGIVEIRGKGAMLGMELINKELTEKVVTDCLEKGIILGWTLHSNTLVRLAPPLIIETALLEETLEEILMSVHKFT